MRVHQNLYDKNLKLALFLKFLKDDSGIILFVVLGILVVLSLLVVGVGRRTSIEMILTKHTLGKLRSKYIAVAGLVYSMDQLIQDINDKELSQFDNRFQCGYRLSEGEIPEDIFKDVKVKDGSFGIFYLSQENEEKPKLHYGFQDEESKININALTHQNYKFLTQLLLQLGYAEDLSETIASSVVDWRDENKDVFNHPYGAEEDYYLSLENPYPCKNQAFDSIEELLLIKGMTPEIFDDLKDSVTIFPKNGRFLVNLDTASRETLQAIARSYTGPKTNTDIVDADSLVKKMLSYRGGDDEVEGTSDDRPLDFNKMGLNAKEMVLFLLMDQERTKISNYLRVRIKGFDDQTKVTSLIEAVIYRGDLSIVYWHRS